MASAAIHHAAGTGAAHPLWGAFVLIAALVAFVAASTAMAFRLA